ncbi:unnamed protein product [Pleuronectes platessa]|uniref:Uncharacterized protein n=1 Tax=Pleuronectes platessa TaxID=8262 RepID=A0A9N7UJQ2_PLEPL|nr:unnamed protein product [Pleuronectes platessa]
MIAEQVAQEASSSSFMEKGDVHVLIVKKAVQHHHPHFGLHIKSTTPPLCEMTPENILQASPSSRRRVRPLQPPDRLMCSNPTKSSPSPGNLSESSNLRGSKFLHQPPSLPPRCEGQVGCFRQ